MKFCHVKSCDLMLGKKKSCDVAYAKIIIIDGCGQKNFLGNSTASKSIIFAGLLFVGPKVRN